MSANSSVHPAAWLAWAGGAALAAVTTTNPFYLLPVYASAWAVHTTHRTSGPAARSIASVERVREAQRLRGIEIGRWSALPALAVPVLATGMDDAMTLAESMDARGHGRGRRTRYRPDRWAV